MEADFNGLEPSTIQFPVNLSCNNNDNDGNHPKRTVMDELDFFARSDNNKKEHHQQTSTATTSAYDKDRVINVNTGLRLLTANIGSDQSMVDEGISPTSENKRSAYATDKIGAFQAEIERVNQENQQLRDMLNQVTYNYNMLQMHLVTLMQQQQQKRNIDSISERGNQEEKNNADDNDCMGKNCNKPNDNHDEKGSISNKAPRFIESSSKTNGSSNIDQAAEATMRKARVSVRARSEATMIGDGCQWRKYGQKIAKGNPCPRAYYRCTMAVRCPVRKQVQRCAEDKTILITTYEGTHSHPLPPTAMPMASATSSAARMLLSGSMPSPDGTALINHPPNFLSYSRFLFPGSPSSIATISASAPFPTVTLDLTQSPNNNLLHQLNHFSCTPVLPPQLFGQPLYNQSMFSGLQVSGQDGGTQNHNDVNVTTLTNDPSFTAALAAAITSLIGNNSDHHLGSPTSESKGNNVRTNDNNSNGN